MHSRSLVRHVLTIIGTLALVSVATLGATAQQATPGATSSADLQRASAYPVSIHQGTCRDLVAQPVGPAVDASVAGLDIDDADAGFIGINAQLPVLEASADYDGTLAYFTEAPHVVVIHESAEEFGTIIACGQIAGFENDGQLVFGIRGDTTSLVSGVAIIEKNTTIVDEALDLIDQEVDFGDDSIHLTVYIVSGASESDEVD
jgi:hypothetical protein